MFYQSLETFVCPLRSSAMGVVWRRAATALRVYLMDKVRSYIGHAEACQALARTALNDEFKLEYVKLAGSWMDLAEERRVFLMDTKQFMPN